MLLTRDEIEGRISLYSKLLTAADRYAHAEASLPETAPPGLSVAWESGEPEAEARVAFVLTRAWSALRDAALRDAKIELTEAEKAVAAFEQGEDAC